MRIIRALVLSGILALPACSSSPTDIDQSEKALGDSTISGGASQPHNDPCGSATAMAVRCVRKQ